ncbi:hypothetical protein T01_2242 [Trichinella spiralis]|uniref:Uncharacterized protein n=1 Tax=Trichinella spiralis TaxID=6334 RepID=A0A0V1BXA9_TRISP|nr:hypothetical protein T01_2242 [Trichinella spiralis]
MSRRSNICLIIESDYDQLTYTTFFVYSRHVLLAITAKCYKWNVHNYAYYAHNYFLVTANR